MSDGFLAGARRALELARENGCRHALLIDGSPSCGSGFVYDGSFSGKRHVGEGVTAAHLRRHGIAVFAHTEVERLVTALAADEGSPK